MSRQENRISDEEFERRLNSKSYDNQYQRNYDDSERSKELQTYDLLHSSRQQNGQALLREMKEFEEQKQMQQAFQNPQQQQQTDGTTPIVSNPNQVNQQRLNTSKITFPKDLKFENFTQDKLSSFFYFSNHPRTSATFDAGDVATANNLARGRNTAYLSIYFSISLMAYYMTKYLKYKNIPWGITYKFSFLGFFTKYFFFPVTMTSTIDKYVFAGPYEKSMNQILSKYSYSDPIFREVFESQVKR